MSRRRKPQHRRHKPAPKRIVVNAFPRSFEEAYLLRYVAGLDEDRAGSDFLIIDDPPSHWDPGPLVAPGSPLALFYERAKAGEVPGISVGRTTWLQDDLCSRLLRDEPTQGLAHPEVLRAARELRWPSGT